jgi:hypothetical protein
VDTSNNNLLPCLIIFIDMEEGLLMKEQLLYPKDNNDIMIRPEQKWREP